VNLVFILLSFPTITETFILNQITALIDRGHTVEIFSLEKPLSPTFHKEVEKYHLLEKTCYFRRYSGRRDMVNNLLSSPFSALSGFSRIVKYLKLGLKVEGLWKLVPFLGKKKFDLIHVHFGQVGAEFIFLKDILRLPFITSFYGYDATQIPREFPSIYQTLFKRSDFIIVLSEAMKEELLRLHCPGEKIRVHHLGVDLNKFKPGEKKERGYNTLLLAGRLVEKKGIPLAIEAFARIKNKYPQSRLKIIGDGYLKDTIEDLIRQHGLQDRITLVGFHTPYTQIKEEMSNADIFILPSHTSKRGDEEGTPMVLMEAQAMGLPVISTFHAGIPEVVIDGETGFLVKEKDIDALADRLAYLLDHPELRLEMGRKGRAHIEKHYNVKDEITHIERLYVEASTLYHGRGQNR
jgi:colanic acid/amylovoran biosynthesis glycosyltransferase